MIVGHIILELSNPNFGDQSKALNEAGRLLKSDGLLIVSVPNLAHLASRLYFLALGKLLRTSSIKRHPGDRPAAEFQKLLAENGFIVKARIGLFPTLPLITALTLKIPSKVLFLHRFYDATLAKLLPNLCFQNIFVAKR